MRDFGAKGDGQTDDTAAVQAAIDAARQAGRGAIAYFPTGRYVVKRPIAVTGRDYTVGGGGFRCGLVWRGEAGRPLVEVTGVQNVTLANLGIGNHDLGPMNHGDDLLVTSPAGTPCRLILDEVYAFGMYQKAPGYARHPFPAAACRAASWTRSTCRAICGSPTCARA